MNKITITVAAALMSLAAYAQDTTAAAQCDSSATAKGKCCPAEACCKADAKKMMKDCCEELNIETVTVQAANGDPIAQFTLAYMTEEGINTSKDVEKAHGMYKDALPALEKAARDGHGGACRALMYMYSEGKGVAKDAAKAAEYKAHFMKNAKEKCCAAKAAADQKDAAEQKTEVDQKAAADAEANKN